MEYRFPPRVAARDGRSAGKIMTLGGTFILVHFVGFLAEGNIPSGGAGLSYNVGVGNGGETFSAVLATQAISITTV